MKTKIAKCPDCGDDLVDNRCWTCNKEWTYVLPEIILIGIIKFSILGLAIWKLVDIIRWFM